MGGVLLGAGWTVLGVGWVYVDGAMVGDCSLLASGLRSASTTLTTMATAAAPMSAIIAGLVRYHGRGWYSGIGSHVPMLVSVDVVVMRLGAALGASAGAGGGLPSQCACSGWSHRLPSTWSRKRSWTSAAGAGSATCRPGIHRTRRHSRISMPCPSLSHGSSSHRKSKSLSRALRPVTF